MDGLTNQLTVSCATPHPSQQTPTLHGSGSGYGDAGIRNRKTFNSLPLVSSLLYIKFSIYCEVAEVNLVGRPDLWSGSIIP